MTVKGSPKDTNSALSVDKLKETANYMRGLNLTALCSSNSGHSGGTLGVMDICAALYLRVARHDPQTRHAVVRESKNWSAGQKSEAV